MRMGRQRRHTAERLSKCITEVLEPRQLLATTFDTNDQDVVWDAGQWYTSGITISGAPAGAIATSANISWKLDGYSMSTVSYRLTGPGGYTSSTYSGLTNTGADIFSGYPESNSSSRTITLPANTAVNGLWSFGVRDSDSMIGMGRIDSWSLTLTYTTAAAPEIQVSGAGTNIVDGDTTPSTTDNTNFGTATQGGSGISKTFVVSNTGTASLTLGTASVPAGYTISQNLPSSIAASSSANLIVQLNTTTAGTYAGDISFSTNDADENPFNFRIGGVVQSSNQAPTNIALSNSTIAENQPVGTPVGTFTTTDPNVGDTFTYTLVSGTGSTDNASFQIVGGELRSAAAFNHETKSSYSIRVRSSDLGGLYYEKAFTITVTNVNETPTDVAFSSTSVNEGQLPGAAVGTFTTSDPDLNDTFTYTLVAGVGADNNASFMVEGNTLKTAAIFNAAAKSSYSIRVRATDAGGAWVERTLGITVTTGGIPTLAWASYLGGSASDYGDRVAIDASGNVWVVGSTDSSGWASGGFDTTHNGNDDAFVVKLNADGTLAWSSYLGGSADDYGYSIAVDGSGNAWVTGYTYSSGWTSGGFDTSFDGGDYDAFVAKINANGTLAWSSYLGGSGQDEAHAIAIDVGGNAWITGDTGSSGWASGGFDTSFSGSWNGFVVKLNADGTLAWSSYLGGGGDSGNGVALDTSGNAFVTGYTYSSGWTSGGFDTSYNGGNGDAFAARIDANGTLAWSTYLGGSTGDYGGDVALDADGNPWVVGWTSSSGWTSGGFDTSYGGGSMDGFVAKLNADGTLAWSSYLGDSGIDYSNGVAADANGDVWVVGYTTSSGWASGGFDTSYKGSYDVYVAKISANGIPAWSSYLGGSGADYGNGVALSANGDAWVVGYTTSSGWASGGFDTSFNGITDAFVAKIRMYHAPTSLSISSSTIAENQSAGTAVGTFSTTDTDPGETFAYSLVGGTGSADNALFTIVGGELRTAAAFDYETRSSYSIRVRSTDSSGLVVEQVLTISITDLDEIAPTITATSISDGATQRSMVKKLAVTFSEPVTLSAGALTVKLSTGAAVPNTAVNVANPSGDQRTYVLTFSGTAVIGSSLADGIYDLIVSAAGVQDLAGNVLTADYTRRFHRLFGDSDGNKVVNALDYVRLKNTLGRASSDPLFNSAFDYEANNLINALDLARFRQRYGLSFSY